jgi:hypothetical protein
LGCTPLHFFFCWKYTLFIKNAVIGDRDVGELEGANGQPVVGADLENGFVMFDVVSMEGTECTQF